MKIHWLIVALVIVIWGVTFASTRALLGGFSALEILALRFGLAFAALALASWLRPRQLCRTPSACICSEWIFIAMGFTGIFAYQFLENCAIHYTNAGNVALLVSFCPIVTALLAKAISGDGSLTRRLVAGSAIAMAGVALVSWNGIVEFELRPLGDLMAIAAMISWGMYSILLDKANARGVEPMVAIRKAFGWSLIMMAPVAAWGMTEAGMCALDGSFAVMVDAELNAERFGSAMNWMNIGFLGLLASAASFVLWSRACRALGVVKTTVALYLTPIVGVVFAAVCLGERVTWLEVLGGAVILAGVAIATKRRRPIRFDKRM